MNLLRVLLVRQSTIIFLFLSIAWPLMAFAREKQVTTIRELRSNCQKTINFLDGNKETQENLLRDEALNVGMCLGNIGAILRTYSILGRPNLWEGPPSSKICTPESWTVDQGIRIFVKWAQENPTQLHDPSEMGVLISHLYAFPCKSDANPNNN